MLLPASAVAYMRLPSAHSISLSLPLSPLIPESGLHVPEIPINALFTPAAVNHAKLPMSTSSLHYIILI